MILEKTSGSCGDIRLSGADHYLGNGALRISALEFQEEYKRVEQAIQAYLQES